MQLYNRGYMSNLAEIQHIDTKAIRKSVGEVIRDTLYKQENSLLPLLDGDIQQFHKLAASFSFSIIENKLEHCDRMSMIKAFQKCCKYNLDPTTGMGKIFLINYNGQVNAQIGYQGLLELAMKRRDIVSNIYSNIVYEGDEFSVEYGNNITYKHIPKFQTRNLWLTYAVVKFTNGDIQIEVSNIEDIEKSKDYSKSANRNGSPWKEHYNSMAKVVPLRKIAKIALSITTDDDEYISHEDMVREKNMRLVSAPISSISQHESSEIPTTS